MNHVFPSSLLPLSRSAGDIEEFLRETKTQGQGRILAAWLVRGAGTVACLASHL